MPTLQEKAIALMQLPTYGVKDALRYALSGASRRVYTPYK